MSVLKQISKLIMCLAVVATNADQLLLSAASAASLVTHANNSAHSSYTSEALINATTATTTSPLITAHTSDEINQCPTTTTTTGDDLDEHLYVKLSTFWYCFLAFITSAGLLVSLVSNMIIIYLFTGTPSLRRNPSNIVAVNLSLSDLLYCIQWPSVIYCSLTQTTWLLEIDLVCQTFGFLTVVTASASVLTVLAMSIERAIVIRYSIHPAARRARFAMRHAWLVVALIWCISLASSVPPLFGTFNRFTLDPSKTSCTLDYLSSNTNYKLYTLVLSIAYWILPAVLISICYALIVRAFGCSSRSLKKASGGGGGTIMSQAAIEPPTRLSDSCELRGRAVATSISGGDEEDEEEEGEDDAPPLSPADKVAVERSTRLRDSIRVQNFVRVNLAAGAGDAPRRPLSVARRNFFLLQRQQKEQNPTKSLLSAGRRCTSNSQVAARSATLDYAGDDDGDSSAHSTASGRSELEHECAHDLVPARRQSPRCRAHSIVEMSQRPSRRPPLRKSASCLGGRQAEGPASDAAAEKQQRHHHGLSCCRPLETTSATPRAVERFASLRTKLSARLRACQLAKSFASQEPPPPHTLRHGRQLRIRSIGSCHIGGGGGDKGTGNSGSSRHFSSRTSMQIRLAKMSFYLILLWLVSWTPIASLAMINSIVKCHHRASALAVFLANTMTKLGPAFDVLIYGVSHPRIKKKFKLIIKWLLTFGRSTSTSGASNIFGASRTTGGATNLRARPGSSTQPHQHELSFVSTTTTRCIQRAATANASLAHHHHR